MQQHTEKNYSDKPETLFSSNNVGTVIINIMFYYLNILDLTMASHFLSFKKYKSLDLYSNTYSYRESHSFMK